MRGLKKGFFLNFLFPYILLSFLPSLIQGWCSGESARLPPMCPGFDSRTRRHMWVEFVVGSLLCSERFFSGYSGFPLSSKTNTSKFQFDLETVDEEPPRGNATANSHNYYYYYYHPSSIWAAGTVLWCECSPLTNVARF